MQVCFKRASDGVIEFISDDKRMKLWLFKVVHVAMDCEMNIVRLEQLSSESTAKD